ncbi:hypothetical protein [Ferrimonas senticii]|uniref:hypothetical protein n=1 Tax=Ferrimonas senticii TaxID=394566 RepID=UPI0003F50EF9|nr:hypothetical protein [Ferrimonas senticii]
MGRAVPKGFGYRFRIVGPPLVVAALSIVSAKVLAAAPEQAQRLHNRLAGVPADAATLTQMTALIESGQTEQAAYIAMAHPAFYSTTLKRFATPWSNIDQDQFAELNDYTATVIGVVRDEVDFRQILQGDLLYVGKAELGAPRYQVANNDHYQALEQNFADLKLGLEAVSQASYNGLPLAATAGVLTSRAAAQAFFYLGTNRAMLRFTLINHLCTDLEPLKDNSLPTDRIRQDVSRSPGGDSRLFINNCSACHSGMDPLAQAFAYYDYQFDREADPQGQNGRIVYNAAGQLDPASGSRVQAKYHINANTFAAGFVTTDDRWDNYWRSGSNRQLGWDQALAGSGVGAKSLGQELANSHAFAQCQVKKVFENVCLRTPTDSADLAQLASSTSNFKANGYRLKQVFAEVGGYCMGE